jgi:GNAT superfamily N-acetyltransferase
MTAPAQITVTDPASAVARDCLSAYYAELARRFPQGFEVSLSRDPDAAAMRPPIGAFLLATDPDTGGALGCVGLKGGVEYGEVKRLWVADAARGRGLARALMSALEDEARALGMTQLRLDTNAALPEAIRLYQTSGWQEIPRFNDDPYPTHFFEKRLSCAAPDT